MVGQRLAGGIGITPILRAGLGLAEGFREVISEAQVWHLGLRRDERTLQALEYYNRLPHQVDLQVAYAVDTKLATGGSAIDAINVLKKAGYHAYFVCLYSRGSLMACSNSLKSIPISISISLHLTIV